MKKIQSFGISMAIIVAIGLVFNGCAGSAMPNAVNGKFYMMGDSNCARYTVLDSNRVMCYNSDGEKMGYRNAMSDQELQQWRFNQSQSNASFQNTMNRINYNNQQQMNRNTYNNNQYMNRNLYRYGY